MTIPLAEAQTYVLDRISRLDTVTLCVDDCLGLCTSAPLQAEESIPPFDNTAVDGFALRTSDLAGITRHGSIRLGVEGSIAAGDPPLALAEPGTVLRIMTGAVIPGGADAVVKVEDVLVEAESIVVSRPIAPGENIRQAGSDIIRGSQLFPARTVLTPAHLGVLASVGYSRVPVFRRARYGVISTGSELVDDARQLRPGEIRDSNRHSLKAVLADADVQVVDLGIVADEEGALTEAFLAAAGELDAIVSSGGVSVGDFDYTKRVLDHLSGGEMRWMQLAVRPAKPFAFGMVAGVPFFGLPGNPVSALVSFELFVRPAIRKMQGWREIFTPELSAVALDSYPRRRDGNIHFIRSQLQVRESGDLVVQPLAKQRPHMLHEMSRSNALIISPDGDGFGKGDRVKVLQTGPFVSTKPRQG